MLYLRIVNGSIQYPYQIGQLRKDNPYTVLDSEVALAKYDVYSVAQVTPPEVNALTQRHEQTTPVQIDGKWTQVWQVVDLPEDQAAANVRAERNRLLAASDWTQLADAPVDTVAWAAYRQALRDLPDHPDFPNVELPATPGSQVAGNIDGGIV